MATTYKAMKCMKRLWEYCLYVSVSLLLTLFFLFLRMKMHVSIGIKQKFEGKSIKRLTAGWVWEF